MITEIFQGTPEGLKARIDALIATPRVIYQVVALSSKSYYLILHTAP
jgi:hypothetical protein